MFENKNLKIIGTILGLVAFSSSSLSVNHLYNLLTEENNKHYQFPDDCDKNDLSNDLKEWCDANVNEPTLNPDNYLKADEIHKKREFSNND
jgi:hypothetical protein